MLCELRTIAYPWLFFFLSLTAAHCPIGSTSTQIIFGAHQMTIVEPWQQRRISPSALYRLHAAYNPSNLNNDIAIVFHATLVLQTPHIQHSNLAGAASGTFAGELATVSGFGRISDASGATSAHLRSVQNHVITNAACSAVYGGIIVPSTICITTVGAAGTCNGDSGGPLTVGCKYLITLRMCEVLVQYKKLNLSSNTSTRSPHTNRCCVVRRCCWMRARIPSWIRSRFILHRLDSGPIGQSPSRFSISITSLNV